MSNFFHHLKEALAHGPVALATVVASQGSTPRVAGARQLITPTHESFGSVGGGVTESRVLDRARETLVDGVTRTFHADLHGKPGDVRDGICGGKMTIWIQRLTRENASQAVDTVNQFLCQGRHPILKTVLTSETPLLVESANPFENGTFCRLDEESFVERIEPSPRLLIVGAGHVGRALARLATELGFAVAIQDDRPEWLLARAFPPHSRLICSLTDGVTALADWEGKRFVALVTRGFSQDREAIQILSNIPNLDYFGILGSKKRVATVLSASQDSIQKLPESILHAPVGIEIGAETPEEIAVSIAAEMIRVLRKHREAAARVAS